MRSSEPEPEHVEREVAAGERDPEVLGRRVLEVEPEHHERRAVRLGPRLDQQAVFAGGVLDESPGDGLVAIEAREHREVGLEALDVEVDADVAREQGGELPLVARAEAFDARERGGRQRGPAARAARGLPLRVLVRRDRQRQQASRIASAAL